MKNKEYKGYMISDGGSQTRMIKSIGSGALPKALKGRFTSTSQAEYAIDKLEADKGAKRAKTIPTS